MVGVDGEAIEGVGNSEASRDEDGTAMEAGNADGGGDDVDDDGEPMTMQKRLLKLAGHDPVCKQIFFFLK